MSKKLLVVGGAAAFLLYVTTRAARASSPGQPAPLPDSHDDFDTKSNPALVGNGAGGFFTPYFAAGWKGITGIEWVDSSIERAKQWAAAIKAMNASSVTSWFNDAIEQVKLAASVQTAADQIQAQGEAILDAQINGALR